MTPVPDGRSGTCKRTGDGPRTFCTYQIGPPPTPQIPPPGAICPPPTPADGKISKPAAARRAGASGRGLGPGFLHVPDRPSAHAPNPASWGDSPSSHPTRRQNFWPAAPGRGQGSWRRSRRRWLYSSQFLQSRNSAAAARIAPSTARLRWPPPRPPLQRPFRLPSQRMVPKFRRLRRARIAEPAALAPLGCTRHGLLPLLRAAVH